MLFSFSIKVINILKQITNNVLSMTRFSSSDFMYNTNVNGNNTITSSNLNSDSSYNINVNNNNNQNSSLNPDSDKVFANDSDKKKEKKYSSLALSDIFKDRNKENKFKV